MLFPINPIRKRYHKPTSRSGPCSQELRPEMPSALAFSSTAISTALCLSDGILAGICCAIRSIPTSFGVRIFFFIPCSRISVQSLTGTSNTFFLSQGDSVIDFLRFLCVPRLRLVLFQRYEVVPKSTGQLRLQLRDLRLNPLPAGILLAPLRNICNSLWRLRDIFIYEQG